MIENFVEAGRLAVKGICSDVIQAPKPEPRIMRHELTGFTFAGLPDGQITVVG